MIKKIFLLVLIISTSFCFTFLEDSNYDISKLNKSEEKLISKDYNSVINRKNLGYETYDYEENPFKNWTVDDAKKQLGALNLHTNSDSILDGDLSELPEHFDWREQAPECVNDIRNQGSCGSCWAFALTNVLGDRFCIQSQGKQKVLLSPQDLVSCDTFNYGCNGGNIFISWLYTTFYGVCSDECKEYVSSIGHNPPCERKCTNTKQRIEYKTYMNDYPKHFDTIASIKKEIMDNGPVESGYIVHKDFYYYKGGVYKYTWGDSVGGHAIKIIGWGVEKETNTDYWIIANSWGRQWGEDGYFRMALKGCNIETNVHSANPKY